MALIKVHKVMISTALIFCGLFSVRGFASGDVAMGGVFASVTARTWLRACSSVLRRYIMNMSEVQRIQIFM